MKKYLFTILAATLAIAGCAKFNTDVPGNNEPDQLINFEAYSYVNSTKADPDEHGHFALEEDFAVRAYYTGNYTWIAAQSTGNQGPIALSDAVLYMGSEDGTGVRVSKGTDNVWAPASDYYWPKTGMISFIGWVPATLKPTFSTTDKSALMTIKDYTVDDDDVMISDISADKTAENTTSATHFVPGVPMLFHHLLAKVNFKAKLKSDIDTDNIKHHAVLNSISILQIDTKGTFTVDGTKATLTGNWTDCTNPVNKEDLYVNEKDLQDIGATYSAIQGELTTTATDLLFKEGDLIVMPQELSDDSVVELEYVIYYCNAAGKILDRYIVKATPTAGNADEHELTPFPLNTFKKSNGDLLNEWDINKAYYYTIIVDPNSDQKITFDPAVKDWDDPATEADKDI